MKVSHPNSWFLQLGFLSLFYFAASTSLTGQILKALHFNSIKCQIQTGLSDEAEDSSVQSFRNLKHFILVAEASDLQNPAIFFNSLYSHLKFTSSTQMHHIVNSAMQKPLCVLLNPHSDLKVLSSYFAVLTKELSL